MQVLVVDEISMCGSNKFAKMNYQVQSLQEGPAKKEFFGGKSLILLGDLKQLPPGMFSDIYSLNPLLSKCGAFHVDSITHSLTHSFIWKADISLNIDVKTLHSNLNHLWALYQRFMNSILYYLISLLADLAVD